ncbi:hypothetical protein OG589_08630 [Sphaerisporangium sp. NBC_01403]|uniref:hypothetical protein n=1 Tax=Sphaerisporangium TaxID=321315 RepID=UPI0032486466
MTASDTVRVYGHRVGGGHLARDHTIMAAIEAVTKGDTATPRYTAAMRRHDDDAGGWKERMTESGEVRVTAALARLSGLGDLPVREHVAVFEEVLSGLEATLASVGDASAVPGDGRR